MNRKAFTLIELLAVIVILAIIALIATPIILGIINSTREEARKRSAEAVSHAVETAYIQTAMKAETNGSASLNNENVIGNTKIDNERSRTTTSITTNDGVVCTLSSEFVLTCTYEGEALITPKNVSNGTEELAQPSTPRYYYYKMGEEEYISGGLPQDADSVLSNIDKDDKPFYFAFDSEDGDTIDAAYICFVTDKEYCLKGVDGNAYGDNQNLLREGFPDCSNDFLTNDGSGCWDDFVQAGAYPDGNVYARDFIVECDVRPDGEFTCFEY